MPDFRSIETDISPEYIVTVLLICYNHESFVEQAVESILFQKLPDGKVEILIADDESSDDTVGRIKASLEDNQNFDVIFLPKQPNVGITKNYQRAIEHCRGRYVAVLEGDDYWTDTEKLCKMINYLEQNRHVVACGHNYLINRMDECSFVPRIDPCSPILLMDAPAIIYDNVPGNFSAMMYRAEALKALPHSLFTIQAYDWIVNICIAQHKPIAILPDIMSVYRIHRRGVWSQLSDVNKLEQHIACIGDYDALTNGIFTVPFNNIKRKLERKVLWSRLNVEGSFNKKAWRNFIGNMVSDPAFRGWIIKSSMPPIFLTVARWIIPPIVIQILRKINSRFL